MSEQEKQYSDFEQRRALQEFHKAVTPDFVESLADEMYVFQTDQEPLLDYFSSLTEIFDNFKDEKIMAAWVVGAIRRRDSEMLNLLADEMHQPMSQWENPRFRQKADDIITGAKPALRLVKA